MNLFLTLLFMTPTIPVIGWLGSMAYDKWLGVEDGERWFEKHEEKIVSWVLVLIGAVGIPLIILLLVVIQAILIS